jgi:hypothetical protein
MIEFAPEMVVPVFYDAFSFANPKAMAAVVDCEPDDGDFPGWDDVSLLVTVAPWAAPYLAAVLAERAGGEFMVTAVCLEFIRQFDHSAPPAAAEDDEEARGEREQQHDEAEQGLDEKPNDGGFHERRNG